MVVLKKTDCFKENEESVAGRDGGLVLGNSLGSLRDSVLDELSLTAVSISREVMVGFLL